MINKQDASDCPKEHTNMCALYIGHFHMSQGYIKGNSGVTLKDVIHLFPPELESFSEHGENSVKQKYPMCSHIAHSAYPSLRNETLGWSESELCA